MIRPVMIKQVSGPLKKMVLLEQPLLVFIATLWSCAGHSVASSATSRSPGEVSADPRSSATRPDRDGLDNPIDHVPDHIEPVLVVSDPDALRAFTELSLHRILSPDDLETIKDSIEVEVRRLRRSDSRAGIGLRYTHRLFDPRWVNPNSFELVGIVNRIDRRVFHPGTCGETRLIYRLFYQHDGSVSRLPMTINVVFFQTGDAFCQNVISRWQRPQQDLVQAGGALAAENLSRLKSVEIDLQLVRWPSTVRPDLAGHAEYLLQVFERCQDGHLERSTLENQPDVARIARDDALYGEFISWLRANAVAIEQGTALLPTHFLATAAISVAPHGQHRQNNRPFTQLLSSTSRTSMSLPPLSHLQTTEALARRLDGLSCTGCHQSRSLAGFHFLGDEPSSDHIDALAVGLSAHLVGDLERRRAYVASIVDGQVPVEHREFPERDGYDGPGAHCTLGTDPSFASWGCAPNLQCEWNGDSIIGVCGSRGIGDSCQPVEVIESGGIERGSSRSFVCPSGSRCDENGPGFPGGMCTSECSTVDPELVCGGIPQLTPFNACLGRGEPFEHCAASTTSRSALRRCDAARPCRDDYVCARTVDGTSSDEGACMPPYFLLQLRVDGHPRTQRSVR